MKNDWYEKGKLPPIGCEVLTEEFESNYKSAQQAVNKEGTVVAHVDDVAIFRYFHDGCIWYHGFYAQSFRPAKTEREKVIDLAEKCAVRCCLRTPDINYIKALAAVWYDSGMLKFPEVD